MIIFYLHSCDNCWFKVGIVLGYIWGVLSAVLCIGCIYDINPAVYDETWFSFLVIQYVIMILYTRFSIVASYYFNQSRNHTVLPISQ